mgnify:CR=1 FL=1
MPLRIALTGATGFVGKTLLPKLLDAGHDVKALVRDPAKLSAQPRLIAVRGALDNTMALSELVKDTDVVVHVAGVISAPSQHGFIKGNVDGTRNLAHAAREAAVPRFVHISSLAATEPTLGNYGASKFAAENVLRDLMGSRQLCILRPSAVYGPGDTATLPLLKALLSATALLPGTRRNRFGMIQVDDLARIIADAATTGQPGTFELDDTQGGHTWPELVNVTQHSFGTPRRVVYIPRALAMGLGYAGDVATRLTGKPALARSGQIRQLYHQDWLCKPPGWPRENPILLAEGLPQTIRWYQAQGLLPRTDRDDTSTPSRSNRTTS